MTNPNEMTLAPAKIPQRCDGCALYVRGECEASPGDPVCSDGTIVVLVGACDSEGGDPC